MHEAVKKSLLVLVLLCTCLIFATQVETYAGTLATSEFIDKMELNGDLRIRYEYKEKDLSGEDPVDRMRQRFRLGMKWNNPEENWKVGAGLTTGPKDANSTDTTYSETTFFETGNISLDYAYAEHKLDCFKFVAGQQRNPFESSWMLWDTDVRQAGFTGQYAQDLFFATLGWYQARYVENDIAPMEAFQVGAKMEMAAAALAFYNYHRTDEILEDLKVANVDSDYDYQILDVYSVCNIKADPVELKPYVQAWYNLGAEGEKGQSVLNGTPDGASLDPEDSKNDLGWIIGVEGKIDRFSVRLDYTQIGSDSCVQALKDGTFGSELNSTDVEGFRAGVTYKFFKNCWLDLNGFFYQAKERDIDQDPQTYQLDLNYKF
jgi:opacity protein-like surface antigen